MSPIYLYKLLPRGHTPVGSVVLGSGCILLHSSDRFSIKVLMAAMKHPSLVLEKGKEEGSYHKRQPKDIEEAVVSRLKKYVHKPYFMSREKAEFPKRYSASLAVSVLGDIEEEKAS